MNQNVSASDDHQYQQLLHQIQSKLLGLDGDTDSKRLFHGRGKTLPFFDSFVVDLFYPYLVITFFSEPQSAFINRLLTDLEMALQEAGCKAVIAKYRYRREVKSAYDVLWGEVTSDPEAFRKGYRFRLEITNQNLGFFLDAEPARQWLEAAIASIGRDEKERDKAQKKAIRVLNLFSYTCAFSVIARASGATEIINIDMSKAALKTGQANHQINQLSAANIRFLPWNILKSWKKIRELGEFDIIIVDPPSFQRGSFVATEHYSKMCEHLLSSVRPSGYMLACLNAPQIASSEFQNMLGKSAAFEQAMTLVEQLAPSDDFPDISADASLKMMVYQKEVAQPA